MRVAEHHVVEPHVAAQGNQLRPPALSGAAPRPHPPGGLPERAVRSLFRMDQRHGAVVFFRGNLHDFRDPLRAGKRRHDKIELQGELVHGHRRLADVDEVGREAAQVHPAGDREKRPSARRDGIIEIGDAHDDRDEEAGISQRVGRGIPQLFIFLRESLHVGALVIKDLDDLLPGDRFLDEPVELPHIFLLHGKESVALFAAVPKKQKHAEKGGQHNQRKQRAQDDQHGKGPDDDDKALNHRGEAVVQGVRDRIDVVGKAAHQLAVRRRVEKGKRQRLHLPEKVPADLPDDFLGDFHHELRVPVRGQYARQVEQAHQGQHPEKPGDVPRKNIPVDGGPKQIDAENVGEGADHHKDRDQREREAVLFQIAREEFQRLFQIFRFFVPHLPRHQAIAPFFWIS